ncbi:TadE/TadG family type IV pilus assembly protein [Novosphingobium sp.]|uniref:TadE/TadG family type IV pilus assembly protein n=1 Tax=Novosphingobium sp. TaxID=1874826 RepID=UPI0035B491D3
MSLIRTMRRLLRHRSGVAMTEFALGAPFLLTAGLWGTEVANFALANMKIGQLAVHLADNASRIGDTSTLQNRKIYESDLNDVFFGAQIQGGAGIDLYRHGRVIISSLEVDPATGRQYIHWQRCRGAKTVNSSYGLEGDGLSSSIAGMGAAGEEVIAQPGDAVIFVEISYTYQPLVSSRFISNLEIHTIASFNVRDSRDLSQIYQRNPSSPDDTQDCAVFNGPMSVSSGGGIS